MKFKLNDKINWCGLTGKIVKITDKEAYPVYVQLDNASKILQFTKGGEFCAFHKADKLLKNVEAAK